MFINSEPPAFRKAKVLAVEISNFEAHFLQHTSYVDTTKLLDLAPEIVAEALTDADRLTGSLAPAIRQRIIDGALAHDVLSDADRARF